MVNTLFSAFTWYVTSIVAPPSIGFLLLGFILGPVMLDFYVRFKEVKCAPNGEDLAGPLQTFLKVEGLLLTIFWVCAAIWYSSRGFVRPARCSVSAAVPQVDHAFLLEITRCW